MPQGRMYVPGNVGEVLDQLSHMLLRAPKFEDKMGYFPHRNLGYVFKQLIGELNNIRQELGEARYGKLLLMSDRIRASFEADPDDKSGETLEGCKIINQMEDILRQVRRKV